jgi:hypothetical protein
VGINSCGWSKHSFRLFIILTTVISKRKQQWYIVSQLSLEHNIWQAWSLVFLPTKLLYLTGMVTSVPTYETFSLIRNNILHQSKYYKNHFENSNFWGTWHLGHVGHVTYSFINMLFISTGIFYDKLRLQIVSVGTTAKSPLTIKIQVKFKFEIIDFGGSLDIIPLDYIKITF